MKTFTVFFCGTGSNHLDFDLPRVDPETGAIDPSTSSYHAGELVSTLAAHHAGQEFVDWIVVDGPGSGNLREDEKWIEPGEYVHQWATATGAGWGENVQHALAVLKGEVVYERRDHTSQEVAILEDAGIAPRTEERSRFLGLGSKDVPVRKVTPQELQARKAAIFREAGDWDAIHVIGWSRGAVTCHMFAGALFEDETLRDVPVYLFAVDPVPGPFNFTRERTTLQRNVASYVGVYAVHEMTTGFNPVLPATHPDTRRTILPFPGRHATLAGNARSDGGRALPDVFQAPGIVVRDLAEKYLTAWGTPLNGRLELSDRQPLEQYDAMLAQAAAYEGLRRHVYAGFRPFEDSVRWVGAGTDLTWTRFDHVPEFRTGRIFVNAHHEALAVQAMGAELPELRRRQAEVMAMPGEARVQAVT